MARRYANFFFQSLYPLSYWFTDIGELLADQGLSQEILDLVQQASHYHQQVSQSLKIMYKANGTQVEERVHLLSYLRLKGHNLMVIILQCQRSNQDPQPRHKRNHHPSSRHCSSRMIPHGNMALIFG